MTEISSSKALRMPNSNPRFNPMTKADNMIERAKGASFSLEDKERQRRSFAFGNAKTENDRVTREMVDKAAEKHPRKR